RKHLPSDLKARAEFLGAVPRSEATLGEKVERALEKRADALRAAEILEFQERRGQGRLVALGPGDVLAHRTTGKLSRVFVDPEDPIPSVKCVSCGGYHATDAGPCA